MELPLAPALVSTHGAPLLLLSDLHLGDGGVNDAFGDRDQLLIDLLHDAADRYGGLVLNGDLFDLPQGGTLLRIAHRRREVLRAIRRLGQHMPIWFVTGNHDVEASEVRDWLPVQVVGALAVDRTTFVTHGHQFDPAFADRRQLLQMRVHCLIERLIGVPIRLPLQLHDSVPNRAVVRGFRLVTSFLREMASAVGAAAVRARLDRFCDYWLRQQLRYDPCYLVAGLRAATPVASGYDRVVLGHSHLPGRVTFDGFEYVNTGSWAGGSATVTTLVDGVATVRDLATGRVHGAEGYQSLHPPVDWDGWWERYYVGPLEYLLPEEAEPAALEAAS
jgi:UDP-2,3-diacylglucosamine pyrophosphatase LpxH